MCNVVKEGWLHTATLVDTTGASDMYLGLTVILTHMSIVTITMY